MTSAGSGSPREVVESMYAAADRNDLDAQLACYAADATYRFDTYGVDVTGAVADRAGGGPVPRDVARSSP